MKAKARTIIDALMTLGLLASMGYQFWGDLAHEWIGTGKFVQFIAQHNLNRKWYKAMFRGKYTPYRILQTVVNLLLLAAMFALMYSGIVLSRHVFTFLHIKEGLGLARRLHILGSYWGFVLMSLHLGLHWNMVISRLPKKGRRAWFFAGLAVALYGGWAFIKRDFPTYMFMRSEFVFLDYEEPFILFYLDCLSMMGTFIFLAHFGSKLAKKGRKKEITR